MKITDIRIRKVFDNESGIRVIIGSQACAKRAFIAVCDTVAVEEEGDVLALFKLLDYRCEGGRAIGNGDVRGGAMLVCNCDLILHHRVAGARIGDSAYAVIRRVHVIEML